MNGLPPHIAQVICGHKTIGTTMAYKAVYPAETIEAHRAFIARRRAVRPGEEYRTPTDEEWDAFLAHFEKRKVSVGTCARAFSTPCIHEHAARIIDAKREDWLGEVEGLQISYSGVKDKLAQYRCHAPAQGGNNRNSVCPHSASISGRDTAPR